MNTVKLFTGTSCPACTALKKRLAKLELMDYTECDVAVEAYRDAITALGYRSIPVLVKYDSHGSPMATMGGNTSSDTDYTEFFTC